MSLADIKADMQRLANPEKAEFFKRFFKTGPGDYAEGDRFLGLTVPDQRQLARAYRDLTLADVEELLRSEIHEHRLTALFIMGLQYQKGSPAEREQIFSLYLSNTSRVNNWDLVDSSAPYIVGEHLLEKDPTLLRKLAKSDSLWERRIAMLATFAFIKRNDFKASLEIAGILLQDKHDLIHKAVGWMLREVGKHDLAVLEQFLAEYYHQMPRTMLRYAIEKFPEARRKAYLAGII
jgi:3-methyladenine DNA glycosylase AlkD